MPNNKTEYSTNDFSAVNNFVEEEERLFFYRFRYYRRSQEYQFC